MVDPPGTCTVRTATSSGTAPKGQTEAENDRPKKSVKKSGNTKTASNHPTRRVIGIAGGLRNVLDRPDRADTAFPPESQPGQRDKREQEEARPRPAFHRQEEATARADARKARSEEIVPLMRAVRASSRAGSDGR